jgi:hypothetical protein
VETEKPYYTISILAALKKFNILLYPKIAVLTTAGMPVVVRTAVLGLSDMPCHPHGLAF